MFQMTSKLNPVSTCNLKLSQPLRHDDDQQYYTDSDDDCSSEGSVNVSVRASNPSRYSSKPLYQSTSSRTHWSARRSRVQQLHGSTVCRTTSGYIRDISTPEVTHQRVFYMNTGGRLSADPQNTNFIINQKPPRDSISTPYSQQTRSDLLSAVHKAWYRTKSDLSLRGPRSSRLSTGIYRQRPVTIGAELATRPKTSFFPRGSKSARSRLVGYGQPYVLQEDPLDFDYLERSTELVAQRLKVMVAERRARSSMTSDEIRARRRRRYTYKNVEEPVKLVDPDKPSRLYRKFRMIAILTVTMVKLLWVIIGISETKAVRTATELQWQTLYSTRRSDRKLSFDKTLYTRERATTKMPNWAIQILDTQPHLRNEQDCRKIHTMMRGMRSFDKFTENIQFSLCRAFTYQCVTEGRVILRKGHIGYNFYFVFSGSAFVNVEDVNSDGEKFVKTEAVVKKGDSFGELALLQDVTRTATVAVRETVELLVVHQDVFAKVCPQIFEKELCEKETFLRKLPIFSHKWWSKEALRNLCLESQIQEYAINKLIVKDSRKDIWIYICMEGKAQIVRCLTLEDDEPGSRLNLLKKRKSAVFLSQDLVELVRKLTPAVKNKVVKEVDATGLDNFETDEKEKLLQSLRLEYVETGKRKETFIEELQENERKKELEYIMGPKTLSSLMADQMEKGKTDMVYLSIGTLHPDDIFDFHSIINEEIKHNSYHLLVSYGARILKVKKSDLFRYATPETIEHVKNITDKNHYPTDAILLESYKEKSDWDEFKSNITYDLLKPHLHNRHRFPQGHLKISSAKQTDLNKQSKLLSTLKTNEKKAMNEEKEAKIHEANLERRQSTAFIDMTVNKVAVPGGHVRFGEPILIRRKSSVGMISRQDTLDVNTPRDKQIKRSKTVLDLKPMLAGVTEEEEEEEENETPKVKTPKSVTIVTSR